MTKIRSLNSKLNQLYIDMSDSDVTVEFLQILLKKFKKVLISYSPELLSRTNYIEILQLTFEYTDCIFIYLDLPIIDNEKIKSLCDFYNPLNKNQFELGLFLNISHTDNIDTIKTIANNLKDIENSNIGYSTYFEMDIAIPLKTYITYITRLLKLVYLPTITLIDKMELNDNELDEKMLFNTKVGDYIEEFIECFKDLRIFSLEKYEKDIVFNPALHFYRCQFNEKTWNEITLTRDLKEMDDYICNSPLKIDSKYVYYCTFVQSDKFKEEYDSENIIRVLKDMIRKSITYNKTHNYDENCTNCQNKCFKCPFLRNWESIDE